MAGDAVVVPPPENGLEGFASAMVMVVICVELDDEGVDNDDGDEERVEDEDRCDDLRLKFLK